MNLSDISAIRLINQNIARTDFKSAKDIVHWMGAMQAQDYAMAKWAVGVRLPSSTDTAIEAAINKGEILRTHLLRPTLHLVSAENIHWMLELTAPQIKAALRSRQKDLEISEVVVIKSQGIMEAALRDVPQLSRDEMVVELVRAGIANDDNRAYHLLLMAELDGILCSGALINGKQSYSLLEKRVPKPKSLRREEALARLAKLYFVSHGPATVGDFAWWSRLSIGVANHALEMVKSDLDSQTIDSQTYWFLNSHHLPVIDPEEVYLLPAFDEFIISYKDRTASLPFENFNKAVSSNGIFRPVIVVNGQVMGIWKRTLKKDSVIVETQFFKQPGKIILSRTEKTVEQYGNFLQKKAELIHKGM
jgi:hypothetical protein